MQLTQTNNLLNLSATRTLSRARSYLVCCATCLAIVASLIPSSICFAQNHRAQDHRVVVVRTTDDHSSTRIIKGIRTHFSRGGLKPELITLTVSKLQLSNSGLIDTVRALRPDVVVPIGTRLTELFSRHLPEAPIVFGALFQPDLSGIVKAREKPGGNVTGASLDIPAALQFKYFKRVCPAIKNVGVIYSEETAAHIPQAKKAAKAAGFTLRAIQIDPAASGGPVRAVYDALDSLIGNVDALWSIADPIVFSHTNTKMILKRTLSEKLPFMGFSETIVASGALFALDFDFKDVGRQVGELAERALTGESPGELPVTRPAVVWFLYNENTERQVSTPIPEELKIVAKKVYR